MFAITIHANPILNVRGHTNAIEMLFVARQIVKIIENAQEMKSVTTENAEKG